MSRPRSRKWQSDFRPREPAGEVAAGAAPEPAAMSRDDFGSELDDAVASEQEESKVARVGFGRGTSSKLTAKEFADLVAPFWAKYNGIQYNENGKKRQPRVLIAAREMFQKLTAEQGNLSFKKDTTVRPAFMLIAEENNKRWDVSKEQLEEWAETMFKRMWHMLRHVQQARCARQVPKWIEKMGLPAWEKVTPVKAAEADEQPEVADEAPPEQGLVYNETLNAWTWDKWMVDFDKFENEAWRRLKPKTQKGRQGD